MLVISVPDFLSKLDHNTKCEQSPVSTDYRIITWSYRWRYRWLDVNQLSWSCVVAVLYEMLSDHYYASTSDIRLQMRLNHSFIPWNPNTVKIIKEQYIVNWILKPFQLTERPYNIIHSICHYLSRFSMYAVGLDMHPDLKVQWTAKCLVDLFELLIANNVTLPKNKLDELRLGENYQFILEAAFINFATGLNYRAYRRLIEILATDIMHDKLNLVYIAQFQSRQHPYTYGVTKLENFKIKSIMILSEIRNDWSIYRRSLLYPYLRYYYSSNITSLL